MPPPSNLTAIAQATFAPNLKVLTIPGHDDCDDDDDDLLLPSLFQQLPHAFPQLESLYLVDNPAYTKAFVQYSLAADSPPLVNLKQLDLTLPSLDHDAFQSLVDGGSKLPQLQALSFNDAIVETGPRHPITTSYANIFYSKNFANLESLALQIEIPPKAPQATVIDEGDSGSEVGAGTCSDNDDDENGNNVAKAIVAGLTNMPKLAALKLDDGSYPIGDKGLTTLLTSPHFPSDLKFLQLLEHEISDEGVKSIANCPKLSKLELLDIFGGSTTLDSLHPILTNSTFLTSLSKLDLSTDYMFLHDHVDQEDSDGDDDHDGKMIVCGGAALATACGAVAATAGGGCTIGGGLMRLRELKLSGFSHPSTPRHLQSILTLPQFSELQVLSLHGCTMSDDCIQTIFGDHNRHQQQQRQHQQQFWINNSPPPTTSLQSLTSLSFTSTRVTSTGAIIIAKASSRPSGTHSQLNFASFSSSFSHDVTLEFQAAGWETDSSGTFCRED